MGTTQYSAQIPRRVSVIVPIPERLTTKVIEDMACIAASRVRFELGAVARARISERTRARVAARNGCA
jgi:hypothetical protein